MYKNFRILALLLAILALSSCQKDLVLDGSTDIALSDKESLTLKQEGETKTVSFSTLSADWTVEPGSYDAWLTVEKQAESLVVTAAANEEANERQSQITINVGHGKKTIAVTQFGTAPAISVENSTGTEVYNHNAHSNVVLKVLSNSKEWRMEQVGKETNDWLTVAADQEAGTLTLALKSIDRGSPWELTSRSEKIFLSNGNKHYQLTVIQNGFLQFQLPVWELDATFDIARLTELEAARGNVREKDFEINGLMPKGEDVEKLYYVFRSAGEQANRNFYTIDYYTKKIVGAFMKAPEGQTFSDASLKPWLDQNHFKPGNKQRMDNESEYFYEDGKSTKLIHIYNDAASRQVSGGAYKSACIKYVESSNELRLNDYGSVGSFPVGAAQRLNDKTFTLDQIIAYEKTRGMIPDFNNQYNTENVTSKIQDPDCPYARLLFAPENPNSDPGNLAYVIYHFNWKGVTPEEIDGGLSAEPALNGTVGLCQVFYMGVNIFYDQREVGYPPYYSQIETSLNRYTRNTLADKGYTLFRNDAGGFATFFRGEEDLIDVQAQSSRVVISYYKSKHYVDQIKKSMNY